ncbi:hypothetical protein GGR56DRAFT_289128 [Xylariaceae sp. FL0804]|nr:hypothetical protein GGR56DRAFT_289128 [Xylariaceae sp. FL0804]
MRETMASSEMLRTQMHCVCAISNIEGLMRLPPPGDAEGNYGVGATLEALDLRLRRLEAMDRWAASPPPMLLPTWDSLAWRLLRLRPGGKPPPHPMQAMPRHLQGSLPLLIDTMLTLHGVPLPANTGPGDYDDVFAPPMRLSMRRGATEPISARWDCGTWVESDDGIHGKAVSGGAAAGEEGRHVAERGGEEAEKKEREGEQTEEDKENEKKEEEEDEELLTRRLICIYQWLCNVAGLLGISLLPDAFDVGDAYRIALGLTLVVAARRSERQRPGPAFTPCRRRSQTGPAAPAEERGEGAAGLDVRPDREARSQGQAQARRGRRRRRRLRLARPARVLAAQQERARRRGRHQRLGQRLVLLRLELEPVLYTGINRRCCWIGGLFSFCYFVFFLVFLSSSSLILSLFGAGWLSS